MAQSGRSYANSIAELIKERGRRLVYLVDRCEGCISASNARMRGKPIFFILAAYRCPDWFTIVDVPVRDGRKG